MGPHLRSRLATAFAESGFHGAELERAHDSLKRESVSEALAIVEAMISMTTEPHKTMYQTLIPKLTAMRLLEGEDDGTTG